jgi:hypothetical protein
MWNEVFASHSRDDGVTMTVTATEDGAHSLKVKTKDMAGNLSPVPSAHFM